MARRFVAVVLALAAATTAADADAQHVTPDVSPYAAERDDPAMRAAMKRYFEGELDEAAVFLGVGVGAGYVGGSLIALGSEFGIGASVPLLIVGAIQAGAGIVLLVRTDGQLADLVALHQKDPAAYRAEELPRMQAVNDNFDLLKIIELCLFGVGAGGLAFGMVDERDGFVGAGIGLMAQSGAMLALDLMAEHRADTYTEKIETLTPEIGVGLGTVLLRGAF